MRREEAPEAHTQAEDPLIAEGWWQIECLPMLQLISTRTNLQTSGFK